MRTPLLRKSCCFDQTKFNVHVSQIDVCVSKQSRFLKKKFLQHINDDLQYIKSFGYPVAFCSLKDTKCHTPSIITSAHHNNHQ